MSNEKNSTYQSIFDTARQNPDTASQSSPQGRSLDEHLAKTAADSAALRSAIPGLNPMQNVM